MKKVFNGLFSENPVTVLLLGLCSALAVTTKVENAYLMGLSVTIILIFSELVVSLIRKLVPENVKTPTYIIIIGTFVTIIELIMKTYITPLYDALGIYLPLIVVNCIILGRCIQVASKDKPSNSMLDGLGSGLGYTLVIVIISFIREVLGNNTITLIDSLSSITNNKVIINVLPNNQIIPMQIFTSPAGAFITLGALIGIINYIKGKKVKHESN